MEIQNLAHRWWQIEPQNTCKHATRRDYIYLSPELAALLREVQVQGDFAEHSTSIAGLQIDVGVNKVQSWPLPATMHWSAVTSDQWSEQMCPDLQHTTSTQWLKDFSSAFENRIDGFVQPNACYGRASHLQPMQGTHCVISAKPHRPGEEPIKNGLLCLQVKQWYRQLRRLQSLMRALRANKLTPDAVEYRLSLWRSILQSSGFEGGFPNWFETRPRRHQGMPSLLPLSLPSAAFATRLFKEFRDSYRRFESWHSRQRHAILKAQHEQQHSLLFQDLREAAPAQVDTLVLRHTHPVIAIDPDTQQVFLETNVEARGCSTWHVDGQPVSVQVVQPNVLQINGDVPLVADLELEQTQVLSSTAGLHHEFVSFWRPRWNRIQSVQTGAA